jgi:hypothetical protein
MPKFTFRLSLPCLSINQLLGFPSFSIYISWLLPSQLDCGTPSRTLTTNESLVSGSSDAYAHTCCMRTQCRCILSSPGVLFKGNNSSSLFISFLWLIKPFKFFRKRNPLQREEIHLITTKMMKRACMTRPASWRKWNMNNRKKMRLSRWYTTISTKKINILIYVGLTGLGNQRS